MTITKIPSEFIQKLKIDSEQMQLQNHNAEKQPFTSTNLAENTNTALEASPIDHNINTIVHSLSMDSNLNETTETDFISTLLDNGKLFNHIQ